MKKYQQPFDDVNGDSPKTTVLGIEKNNKKIKVQGGEIKIWKIEDPLIIKAFKTKTTENIIDNREK